jgi:ABC-type branched-subunit amino acid transport system ATPase component
MSATAAPGDAAAPVAADEPLLALEGVSRHFGGVQAVHNLSLRVPPGQICALIGPNGAGKTTVINLVSGVCRPSAGTIRFAGADIGRLPSHRLACLGIGRTFQNLQLFGRMSVAENIAVGLHSRTRGGFLRGLLGGPGIRREERFVALETSRILETLELAALAGQVAAELPYGLQKRLEIGRALAARPRLLLLDEPAAGLNAPEKREMACLVQRIRAEGVTVILVEHDMELVMGISDSVAVLDYGQLIACGPPGAVQCDPRVVTAYLGRELAPC